MLSAQPVPPPVIPSKKSAPVVPAVPVAPATPSVSAPSTGTVTPSAPSRPIISSDLGGRELSILQRANEHSGIMQRLAELGRTKANAEPVRVLADLLGTTEAKEHAQLLALTQAKGITLSEAVIPKKMQDRLVAAPKDAFDHAWLDEVSGLIKTAIQNYSSGSTSSDKDIKKFAADGLALAEQKLDVVKKVAAH
jgi:multidrug efflux pump subunit AcrA (membrane-fusion protein)